MRSEVLTALKVNLKFGRTLLLILDDGPEAQDMYANQIEHLYIFCDNYKKKSNNENSSIRKNKIMIVADYNQDSYLLGNISTQLGETNSFITDSRITSPNNNSTEDLTVQGSFNQYSDNLLCLSVSWTLLIFSTINYQEFSLHTSTFLEMDQMVAPVFIWMRQHPVLH